MIPGNPGDRLKEIVAGLGKEESDLDTMTFEDMVAAIIEWEQTNMQRGN